MQVHRDAHAGLLLPWGWVALCLMSLLHLNNLTYVATETTAPGISPSVPTNESSEKTTIPNILGSTNSYLFPQGSNETTSAISETMINFTATTGNTSGSGTTQAFVQSQTSPAVTLPTTSDNASTSEMTWEPSVPSVNVSDYSPNNISFEMTSTTEPYAYTSSSIAPITIKGEIKCSGIREVRLAQGICLELSEAASCDEFKKEKGEGLTQILCGKEGAEADAGASVCSLLLAQSEVRPECLLMVLANSTELSSKLQLMEKHQSDLRKLGIQSFNKQDIGSHQSYSRKTLIALVTSGVLLAILGTTGYFLMNRRSWSPTGERLGEDPYYTENGGGQGYSSGPGSSPETQGKASVTRGAQENGTGQATSRNGHSARQHVVADTEL
ncbi:hematopoietic progenitor cell antigen CD34 isoform X1 [Peromyscus californicus insignis]|uniref:hematopoietic progenitor cell antigen CD34 isoform X1 n=1 Tax=Peromyscus californicus insignis TaxID=564181 RepID=UPI0022A709EE|nr:hematopoietic progenitor cell antigen CD34 isoform X1 [Peromyscus californicus insignis]